MIESYLEFLEPILLQVYFLVLQTDQCVRLATVMKMIFEIATRWNGKPINHAPVKLKLQNDSRDSVSLELDAPFFDDPKPAGVAGQPFPQLWDYEVVEAFFLGKDDKYLEVEFCPHGQHLVLMLSGRRNMVKDELALEFASSINKETMRWTGKAKIPLGYFPPSVSKFNAYAIHGTGEKRVYEALYPAEGGKHSDPDFHRLEYFHSTNFSGLLINNDVESELWKNTIAKGMQ